MKEKSAEPLKTLLTIVMGFIVVFYLSGWKWALIVSFCIGIIGIFSSWLSTKIHFLWMKLAWLLSLIIPNILLAIIFYLLLFPLSLLSRIFSRKDPLCLKNPSGSLFKETRKTFDKASFEKLW